MKILLIHNYYRHSGGEDVVFQAEADLLRERGHSVVTYTRANDEISHYGILKKISLAGDTIWSRSSKYAISKVIAKECPDLVHFHNTFPLISPAAYYGCREAGVPMVQTLHNYRLICPSAMLFRGGGLCEECIDHGLLRSIRYGCYRDSRVATATVAGMLAFHHMMDRPREMPDCYIALTQFSRRKFIEGGLPSERIFVKPNFLDHDPGARTEAEDYAVFIGRLSPEKGVRTLVSAWEKLTSRVNLRIVGEGPLRLELGMRSGRCKHSSICFEGRLRRSCVVEVLKRARFLVLPSECYETFGLVIIEAFACGVPVITSRLGAMEEIVEDGCTGLHFTPGDSQDLAAKVEWAWNHPQEMEKLGRNARAEYESRYTAEQNYGKLTGIYKNAIAASRPHREQISANPVPST